MVPKRLDVHKRSGYEITVSSEIENEQLVGA